MIFWVLWFSAVLDDFGLYSQSHDVVSNSFEGAFEDPNQFHQMLQIASNH